MKKHTGAVTTEPQPTHDPAPASARLATGHERLQLADGTSAHVVGEALEVRAPDGMLLVRYEGGTLRIAPPQGDLELVAPSGRVRIRSGMDVEIEAARDLKQGAGRSLSFEAPAAKLKTKKLAVDANEARVAAGRATVLARSLVTSAESIAQRCVKYDLEATKLVEKTREAFRDVSDLAQSRIGRARTIVSDVYTLFSRRSVMVSKEDTTVDGSKILLG
jgi:hypothetical protein